MEVKPPFRLRTYARAMFKRRDLRMFACLWRRQGRRYPERDRWHGAGGNDSF